MFDMGFTEMMLIGIVALVVIGPERLPGVARAAGKYFSKLRSFMTSVRADVESELKADELREMFEAQKEELQSLKEVVGDASKDVGLSDIADEMSDVAGSIDDAKPNSSPKSKKKKKVATKKKVSTRAKAPVKKPAKSRPRANSVAGSKTKSKLTPRVKTKSRTKSTDDSVSKAKTQSNWTSAIVPPAEVKGDAGANVLKVKSKATKSAKVKSARVKAK